MSVLAIHGKIASPMPPAQENGRWKAVEHLLFSTVYCEKGVAL